MNLLLQYRRVNVDRCQGQLLLGEEQLYNFNSVDFDHLFRRVARAAVEHPEVQDLVIQRTDREGLLPLPMGATFVDLLRSDPLSAIRGLSREYVAPAPETRRSAPPTASVFKAGHDTLADAFGDKVYVARRTWASTDEPLSMVECPSCSLWTTSRTSFVCAGCQLALTMEETENWGLFSVEDLLQKNLPQYYLPRRWNPTRSWLSQAELAVYYALWKSTKESFS